MANMERFANPYKDKELDKKDKQEEVTEQQQEQQQKELVQEEIKQDPKTIEEEIQQDPKEIKEVPPVNNSNNKENNNVEISIGDALTDKVTERYINHMNRKKASDFEVKTSVYLDEDIYEKLNKICTGKMGLKKIIFNVAIEEFVNSGKADKMAHEFDLARKDDREQKRRRYDRAGRNLGVDIN